MTNPGQSPFILGRPVRPPEFHGRTRELQQLLHGIENRRSFLVHGARRIGKTSLLLTARDTLDGLASSTNAIFVDAQASKGSDALSTVAREIIRQHQKLPRGSKKALSLIERHPFEGLRELLRNLPSHSTVVFIDEIDSWYAQETVEGEANWGSVLRSLISTGALTMVASAFLPSTIERSLHRVSPLWNLLSYLRLGAFNRAETSAFIRERFNRVGLIVEPGLEQHIVDLSGGYPFLLQFICQRAYEILTTSDHQDEAASALDDALRRRDTESILGFEVRRTLGRISPVAIASLVSLAESEEGLTREQIEARLRSLKGSPVATFGEEPVSNSAVANALSELESSSLVRSDRDRERFEVLHGLLRLYIRDYSRELVSAAVPTLQGRFSKVSVARGAWEAIDLEVSSTSPFAIDVVRMSLVARGGAEVRTGEERLSFQGRTTIKLLVKSQSVGLKTVQATIKYQVLDRPYEVTFAQDIEFIVPVEDFTPVRSPYVFGVPVTDPLLFRGRDAVVKRIVQALRPVTGKRDLALVGRRRIGKTSILLHLPRVLADAGMVGVFINLETVEPRRLRVFHEALIDGICAALVDWTKHSLRIRTRVAVFDWRRQLRTMRVGVKSGPVEIAQGEPKEYQAFERDLRCALRLKRSVKPACDFIVIMLDEATLLTTFEDRHALSYLRGIIQSEQFADINWIIAGNDLLYTLTSKESSPLYNLFLTMRVRALDDQAITELVEAPVRDQGVEYSPEAVAYIRDVTSGIPYWVQAVCHHGVDVLNDRRKRDVQLRDAQEAVRRLVQHQDLSLLDVWNGLSGLERFVFCLVVESDGNPRVKGIRERSEALQISVSETRVLDIMGRLESLGIVSEEDGKFTIDDGILREWVKSRKRSADLVDAARAAVTQVAG